MNAPIAPSTPLGWIVSRPIPQIPFIRTSYYIRFRLMKKNFIFSNVSGNLMQFPTPKITPLLLKINKTEDHFKTTHLRDHDDRYVVRLPFKGHPSKMGASKPKVIRMISRQFDKFNDDPIFANLCSNFMTEFANLGHMKLVPTSAHELSHAYYLPHHGVLKESSITTK